MSFPIYNLNVYNSRQYQVQIIQPKKFFQNSIKSRINRLQINFNQENLTALMILESENDILQTIIKEFCQTKARKKLVGKLQYTNKVVHYALFIAIMYVPIFIIIGTYIILYTLFFVQGIIQNFGPKCLNPGLLSCIVDEVSRYITTLWYLLYISKPE